MSAQTDSNARPIGGFLTERFAIGLVLTVFMVLLPMALSKGLFKTHGNDLTNYMYSANLFFRGFNPYGIKWGSYYPLFASVFVQPLNYIPVKLAHMWWYIINFSLLVFTLKFVQTRVIGGKYSWVAFLFMLLPLVGILQNHMLNAQINIIVMSCSLGFILFLKEGKENLAALCLAGAISLKLLPAMFLLFLLVNRKFILILKALLFVSVMTVAIPYMVAGDNLWEYYIRYFDIVTGREHSELRELGIFLVGGFMSKFYLAWIVLGFFMLSVINIAANRRLGAMSLRVIFVYFISLLIAVPGILQTHHMVWLFPAVLAITHDLYNRTNRIYRRRIMTISLVIFYSLCIIARHTPAAKPVYLLAIGLMFFMALFWVFDEKPVADGGGSV